MKNKKIVSIFLLIALLVMCVFVFSACNEEPVVLNGKSAYLLYKQKYGYDGTEEQWLKDLVNGNLSEKYNCTVTFDPQNGDDQFTKTVHGGEKVERPENPERYGYNFVGWVYYDGVEYEKWSFGGYCVTANMTLTAKWEYATYELPIININTNGAKINSKEDYTDMTFSIENCEDELIDITGGIRLRGNSTMQYDKKPYRIKFDKKQSLFGLEKAKSWVLLAEYLDPSALHNYAAFKLASEMDGLSFTPSPNKVNVYLNGDFVGLYTLCEQVQENEGRMNIELDEITEDMTNLTDFNFFVCMDKSASQDATAVLDETYFYLEEHDLYFELKYPEKDQFVSDAQFESFFTQLKVYINDLIVTFKNKDVAQIANKTNVNSLVDYLIIDQIMGERDHAHKSFNMYYTKTSLNPAENNKLSFGPIWDYDWSCYTPWTGSPNKYYEVTDRIEYSNIFFQAIATTEYMNLVKERYNAKASSVLGNFIEQYDDLINDMEKSIVLNEGLWYTNQEENISNKNVEFFKKYLEKRKETLDNLWG